MGLVAFEAEKLGLRICAVVSPVSQPKFGVATLSIDLHKMVTSEFFLFKATV